MIRSIVAKYQQGWSEHITLSISISTLPHILPSVAKRTHILTKTVSQWSVGIEPERYLATLTLMLSQTRAHSEQASTCNASICLERKGELS